MAKTEIIVRRKEVEEEWNRLVNQLPGVENTQIIPYMVIKTFINYKPGSEDDIELRDILTNKIKIFEKKIGKNIPNIRFEDVYI